MAERECHFKNLLMLNDWINVLGFELRLQQSRPSKPPALFYRASIERHAYVEGRSVRKRYSQRVKITVTKDPIKYLEFLGFDEPKELLASLQRTSTNRMVCSLLCGSRLFEPHMADNTNFAKFGGISQLTKYVESVYPDAVFQEEHPETIKKKQALFNEATQRFSKFPRRIEAVKKQMNIYDEVEAKTWGASSSNLRNHEDRWSKFLSVYGLIPLHAMPDAEALSLWIAFRDDPLAQESDWIDAVF